LADHQARTQLPEDRQVDVEADRQVEAQALVAAAFRRKRDTEIHRLALVADIDLVAVPEDFPGGKRLAAVETKRELAAAGADKAVQADDLPGAHAQRHVLEARPRQAAGLHDDIADRHLFLVIDLLDRAVDHQRDQLVLVGLAYQARTD